MSDFRFDIGFQILGQKNITAVRRELAAAGYSLETVERTTKKVGNALHNLQKLKINGLVDPADEARIKRIINQFGGGTGPTKFKTIDQFAKSQKENDKARNTEIRTRLVLERLQERARRLQERQDASAEKERERVLRFEQKVRTLLDKQIQKRHELANLQAFKDSERILAVQKKIADSQVNIGTKTAEQQQKVQAAVSKSTAALTNAKEQAKLYHEAMIRGDVQAAAQHRYMAQSFIKESNTAANAAVAAANKQVRANNQVHTSQRGILQNIASMRTSLNTIGFGLGLFAAMRGIQNLTGAIGGAFLESIKFNDELARGKVLLTSFGVNHLGNKTLEEISLYGTEAEKGDLKRAKAFSANMMNIIREQAAYTGQDMAEVISIVRMALPDLMNKWKGEGNVFLEEGGKVEDFTKKFIQLSSVLKMYDTQRKLPFHAFAITEAFSGTADAESKSRAAGNFISLIRRENIKVADEYQKAITQAVNSGDPFKAMDVMTEALAKAGVTTSKIKDLHSQTLASFSSVIANMKMFFAELTNPAFETIVKFLQGFSKYLSELSQNSRVLAFIRILGQAIDKQLTRALDWAIDKFDYFIQMLNTPQGENFFFDMIKQIESAIDTFTAFGKVIAAFFAGVIGMDKDAFGKGAEGIRSWFTNTGAMKADLEAMIGPAQEFGREIHNITSSMAVLASILMRIASLAGFFFGDENTRFWGIEGKGKKLLGDAWNQQMIQMQNSKGAFAPIPEYNYNNNGYNVAQPHYTLPYYHPNPKTPGGVTKGGTATITQQITGPVTIVAQNPQELWNQLNNRNGVKETKSMEDALNAVGIGVGLGGLATYQR